MISCLILNGIVVERDALKYTTFNIVIGDKIINSRFTLNFNMEVDKMWNLRRFHRAKIWQNYPKRQFLLDSRMNVCLNQSLTLNSI